MKILFVLLTAILLPGLVPLHADEPAPAITRSTDPGQPGEFSIQIAGDLRGGYKGYLRSAAPFTLQQAIEAAGGLGEWAGEIYIYSSKPSSGTPPEPPKRIHNLRDPKVRDLPLVNGSYVFVKKIGSRFK